MAVGGYDRFVYIGYIISQKGNLLAILKGGAVSCGVGDVDHRGTSSNHCLYHPSKVFVLGTPGILGIKLNIVTKPAGIFDTFYCPLQNIIGIGAEFVFNMEIRSADPGVDPFPFCIMKGICRNVYILFDCSCKCANYRLMNNF
ncbi:hypothetical protein SDC9_94118 [bioreactor metagenome]|uniref:Uncharacterized protein n=1 Tax=bioreactor metagenome TaxID=1076179 RepID=A0A645A3X0_9ZZZZ